MGEGENKQKTYLSLGMFCLPALHMGYQFIITVITKRRWQFNTRFFLFRNGRKSAGLYSKVLGTTAAWGRTSTGKEKVKNYKSQFKCKRK